MKKNILQTFTFWVCCLVLTSTTLFAQQIGDTTWVETFTFEDPSPNGWNTSYKGSFDFPSSVENVEKVLMYYTLKCDPATNGDSFDCGEWDYTTRVMVTDSTAKWDSTFRTQVAYTANGATPDSFAYTIEPSNTYFYDWQYKLQYTDTLFLLNAQVGNGETPNIGVLNTAQPIGHSQFLWRSSEILAGGLDDGLITGIKLRVDTIGSEMKNLTIRMKNSNLESVDSENYESEGFTTVYRYNTSFEGTGWQTLNFFEPFDWDLSSNVVIDFSYENEGDGADNWLRVEFFDFESKGFSAAVDEHYLSFQGLDYVDVPNDVFSTVSDQITISCWVYGDPEVQPQSDYLFEGRDAAGNRVVNVHFPWGNGQVYWDAGNSGTGSYDRINQPAAEAEYEGRWNHWAFTKNATSGEMRIYLNGELWHFGTGMTRTMEGITDFRIGASATNTSGFDGYIDDFRIWNLEIDQATIAEWANKDVTQAHPNYDNLISYYKMNEGEGQTLFDSSETGNDATTTMFPGWRKAKATDYYRNLKTVSLRPNIIFEQGAFTSIVDSVGVVDSLQNAPVALVSYGNTGNGANNLVFEDDSNHPNIPTETLYVWEADVYTYTYVDDEIVDSTYVPAIKTVYQDLFPYYHNVVTWEILRFITPYGINLDLGPEGTTWVFDVTDYAPVLTDQVHFRAGNNQELLDMRFAFIQGVPARPVVGLKRLWNGNFSYDALYNDERGEPLEVLITDESAETFRVKARISGHGFGGIENCAEFCNKTHWLYVNGIPAYNWQVWNECADNPLYPQGGTWIYDRAGWCPGAVVTTNDFDLTPYLSPNEPLTIDYGIAAPSPIAGPEGNYELYTHLISYGAANFQVDAGIEEILAPNDRFEYSRFNPMCSNPTVVIKNNGLTDLTSLTITYGVMSEEGATIPCDYTWEGSLGFLETEEVTLPLFNWTNLNPENPRFFAEISSPNGAEDEYAYNNTLETSFVLPSNYSDGVEIQFLTNSTSFFENSYTLTDDKGNVLYERGAQTLSANTIYSDDWELASGCYTLRFEDAGDDGISFWANNDGSGWVRLRDKDGNVIVAFEPDYGDDIIHHFTVGYDLGEEFFDQPCSFEAVAVEEELNNYFIDIYPNPTQGEAFVEVNFADSQDITLRIINTLGQTLEVLQYDNIQQDKIAVEMPAQIGLYFLQLETATGKVTHPIVVSD